MFRVQAEEVLESLQKPGHIQASVWMHVPGGFLDQIRLGRRSEFSRHHFGVDGIGHAGRVVPSDQAEIARVFQIPVRVEAPFGAAQQRFDHASHTVFAQLVR